MVNCVEGLYILSTSMLYLGVNMLKEYVFSYLPIIYDRLFILFLVGVVKRQVDSLWKHLCDVNTNRIDLALFQRC